MECGLFPRTNWLWMEQYSGQGNNTTEINVVLLKNSCVVLKNESRDWLMHWAINIHFFFSTCGTFPLGSHRPNLSL